MQHPRSSRFSILAALVLLALAAPARKAAATCGCSSCFLVTGTREGLQGKGKFTVEMGYQHVNNARMRAGSDETDVVLVPKINFEERVIEPEHHREIRSALHQVDFHLGYGLSDRMTLVFNAPLYVDRFVQHFDRHEEEDGHPDAGDERAAIAHALAHTEVTETFRQDDGERGFGDVQVGVRYGILTRPRDLLVGGFHLKLPTGPYRMLDAEGAINETTTQPGTGSWDGIFNFHYSHQFLNMKLDGFAAGSWRKNGENDLDYHIGDETLLSLGGTWRAGGRVTPSLQLNLRHAGRDQYIDQEVPSTGSTYLNLSPGLRLDLSQDVALNTFVQLPVYQYVNEAQLAPSAGVLVGLSKSF